MKKLKTIDIKGKDYVTVDTRLIELRENHPDAQLLSEMVSNEGGVCIFKSSLLINGAVVATGHAYEKEGSSFINKTSYIENCETSSWGRCLSNYGIGLQSGVASYEEVANAKAQQTQVNAAERKKVEGPAAEYLAEIAEAIGESDEDNTACIWHEIQKHKDGRLISDFVWKNLESPEKAFIKKCL